MPTFSSLYFFPTVFTGASAVLGIALLAYAARQLALHKDCRGSDADVSFPVPIAPLGYGLLLGVVLFGAAYVINRAPEEMAGLPITTDAVLYGCVGIAVLALLWVFYESIGEIRAGIVKFGSHRRNHKGVTSDPDFMSKSGATNGQCQTLTGLYEGFEARSVAEGGGYYVVFRSDTGEELALVLKPDPLRGEKDAEVKDHLARFDERRDDPLTVYYITAKAINRPNGKRWEYLDPASPEAEEVRRNVNEHRAAAPESEHVSLPQTNGSSRSAPVLQFTGTFVDFEVDGVTNLTFTSKEDGLLYTFRLVMAAGEDEGEVISELQQNKSLRRFEYVAEVDCCIVWGVDIKNAPSESTSEPAASAIG